MLKRQFIPNVGDVRKSFIEYRKQLEELLVKSYSMETELVNRIVGLEHALYNLNCDIIDGTVQNP